MPDNPPGIADLHVAANGHGQPPPPWYGPAGGPPQTPDTTPDADLTDVLVNYETIFGQVHGRYHQMLAQLMQEAAELRAGFNQAVARMKAAEAEAETLRGIVENS